MSILKQSLRSPISFIGSATVREMTPLSGRGQVSPVPMPE